MRPMLSSSARISSITSFVPLIEPIATTSVSALLASYALNNPSASRPKRFSNSLASLSIRPSAECCLKYCR